MTDSHAGFLEALRSPAGATVVELRPPSLGLTGSRAMDAWIGLQHEARRLVRAGYYLFLTDNAVGAAEEENLAHLGANLAGEVDPSRIIPFLTSKHSLDYCLLYAERAWAQGFRALVVLGGDRTVGPSRCVPHAYQLRRMIRERVPGMALGGWANPHRDPREQASYLADPAFEGDFWLSQVVSHHAAEKVRAFLREVSERGVKAPGLFGVFFYRSARPDTLRRLGEFFPVPAEELAREFKAGATPEDVCGRTVAALKEAGVRNFYFSNLVLRTATGTLERVCNPRSAGR